MNGNANKTIMSTQVVMETWKLDWIKKTNFHTIISYSRTANNSPNDPPNPGNGLHPSEEPYTGDDG